MFISPSKTFTAGPVIYTCPSVSSHLILSVPPSIITDDSLPHLPVYAAATAVAHAPVPHAIVIPEPRSHTLMRISPFERICANSTFTRSGHKMWVSH